KVDRPRLPDAGVARAEAAATAELPGGSETILVMEDEPLLRSMVRELLLQLGYEVLVGRDVADALRLCAEHPDPIHLLLTDVVMPGMSGSALAVKVRARHPETRVLYMSGYADDAVVRHGVLHAEAAFLRKPFSTAVLAREVSDVLHRGR